MRRNEGRYGWAITGLCVLVAALTACGSQTTEADAPAEQAGDTGSGATTPPPATPPPDKPVWLAASHVLIQYESAERVAAGVSRSKEEALALAEEVAAKAKSGEDFAALAKQYSDGPSAPKGGSLGRFASTRMVPPFSNACMALEVGETSDVVETQFGYHIIRRDEEVVKLAGARHILIMHELSARKPPGISRSKEEARARAEEVLARLESGDDFAALAGEYSDGPTKTTGGNLGSFPRGTMVAPFDQALFALDVNQTSGIVETPFGYHIILRTE